jgi:spore maturation protein CgeB
MSSRLRITILGLSITSSWGNGHATTYRSLVRELAALGHRVTFLERDVPWYSSQRDLADPPFCSVELYRSLDELRDEFEETVRDSDAVVVGSYVPDGVAVGDWVLETAREVTAFYDIDTPVTLAKLARADYEYLSPEQISRYRLYLSFTGGPVLDRLEREYGAARALPLYCSFDPTLYYFEEREPLWDLGYMGTYSEDRQPTLNELLLEPARQWSEGLFVVAGPQYPAEIEWPANVQRVDHLPPSDHRDFYNSQRFTLNVTRADMIRAGYSPSVRLFEAAACGVPVISDYWPGLEEFFVPDEEILIAESAKDSLVILQTATDTGRRRIGERAKARVLSEHTAAHRAAQLESYLIEEMERLPNARAAINA